MLNPWPGLSFPCPCLEICQSSSRSRYVSFFVSPDPVHDSLVGCVVATAGGDRLSLIEDPESEGRIRTVVGGWVEVQLNIPLSDDLSLVSISQDGRVEDLQINASSGTCWLRLILLGSLGRRTPSSRPDSFH